MHVFNQSLWTEDGRKGLFWFFVADVGTEVRSILPGLDRGASEDLSLQALKSDDDL